MVPRNNENRELDYDPCFGVRKEEIEWQLEQRDAVHQRMKQAVNDLTIQSQKMRRHFLTDPDALRRWDEFVKHTQFSFFHHLESALNYPPRTPNSVLYEHLMKKKAHRQSFAGMLKAHCQSFAGMLKAHRQSFAGMLSGTFQAKVNNRVARAGALVAPVAAGFAAGFAAGMMIESYVRRKQQTQET